MSSCFFLLYAFAACNTPGPAMPVWDHPMDVMHCRLIDRVSGPVPTEGGFAATLNQMTANAIAIGGTDLLLRKRSHDWSVVTGEAYVCGPHLQRREPVLRVRY